ncbi:RluA family pseudouridine synthase [Candidatus Chrysopegis kryptomonas]|uniref:Pseudouridine synthase n=1 Tax=Candidatus Chryseopegocella kryptomonas TaxID=1633643 RepID=A0A0N7MY31_9BACT|nr:RluA family pseudouridine synthase [Candidatus Chrysopegis kryptomonas]CUT03107.1 23S rRNA pseudouridine1911/1915/1917 synthase [Candidatus Chrysopegis kryptomonas]
MKPDELIEEIETIYEDEDFIVLNKPAGVLTIPDRFARGIPNLYDILKEKYGEIFVVHRLDKETSGVICFAKNEEAHSDLSEKFEEHEVKKIYLALITGHLRNKQGRIDIPLSENPKLPGTMKVDYENGKRSITEYRVLEEFENFSLLEVRPLTGRMHQIRVHFKAIGHPLAIDPVYGGRQEIFLSEIKKKYKPKEDEPEKPLMSRLTLHALRLGFFHFRKKEYVEFEARLPKDFESLLKQLRKYSVKEDNF